MLLLSESPVKVQWKCCWLLVGSSQSHSRTGCSAGTQGRGNMRNAAVSSFAGKQREQLKSVGPTSPHTTRPPLSPTVRSLSLSLTLSLFLSLFLSQALLESHWLGGTATRAAAAVVSKHVSDTRLHLTRGDSDAVRYSKFTTRTYMEWAQTVSVQHQWCLWQWIFRDGRDTR